MSFADYYVSPDGNDEWSGVLEFPNADQTDGPFATLERARRAVRDRIDTGLERDIQVFVRGGVYEVTEPIVFDSNDSPGERFSVRYMAYPGEKPVFTASIPLDGWRKPEQDEVPEGLDDDVAPHIFVADGDSVPDQVDSLFDERGRLPRARAEGFIPEQPETEEEIDKSTLHFPEGAMRNWPHLDDVELVIRPNHPWVLNRLPVSEIDEETGVVRTGLPGTYKLLPTWGGDTEDEPSAWVENVPEGLTAPGDWMFDGRDGRVYLWPRSGEKPENVRVSVAREIIRVDGGGESPEPVQNLAFSGLMFQHGARDVWSAEDQGLQHDWDMFDKNNAVIRLRGAENCEITDCTVAHTAGTGIRLDLHCQNNRVQGCCLEHVGGTGILLAGFGPGELDVNHHNAVVDNFVSECGELWWHGPGIFVWQSGHNHIAHNLVRNQPYIGIVVSGVRPAFFAQPDRRECGRTIRFDETGEPGRDDYDEILSYLHSRHNLVERNEVHDCMERMFDGNGIYISGTGSRNVIKENYVHDIFACQSGIRTDDWQFETLLTGNVVCRCLNAGFILKGVNDIEYNVVANLTTRRRGGGEEEIKGCIALRHTGTNHPSSAGSRVHGNIFFHDGAETRFFEDDRAPIDITDIKVDYNMYYVTDDPQAGEDYIAESQACGQDRHSLGVDPGFVDPEADDFRLSPDSDAKMLGMSPIDVSETGPR